jgi:hypothetical protein
MLLLLLSWHYSPIPTFDILTGLLPVSSVFEFSFQVLILRLLISVCTQFHLLVFGRQISRLPWGLL